MSEPTNQTNQRTTEESTAPEGSTGPLQGIDWSREPLLSLEIKRRIDWAASQEAFHRSLDQKDTATSRLMADRCTQLGFVLPAVVKLEEALRDERAKVADLEMTVQKQRDQIAGMVPGLALRRSESPRPDAFTLGRKFRFVATSAACGPLVKIESDDDGGQIGDWSVVKGLRVAREALQLDEVKLAEAAAAYAQALKG